MCLTAFNPSDACCASIPPTVGYGHITRIMQCEPIDDYAGLSDAAWQFGITGTADPSLNEFCFYHHFVMANARYQTVRNVLNPIRCSFAAPETDGGNYDMWQELGPFPGQPPGYVASERGISPRTMPREWHCRFRNDIAVLIPGSPHRFPRSNLIGGPHGAPTAGYLELALEAIAPGLAGVGGFGEGFFECEVFIQAWRFRVNGRFAGPLFVNSEDTAPPPEALRFRCPPGSRVEIDLWLRIGQAASLLEPDGPAKGCVYIPLSNVETGSRKRHLFPQSFFNVDFSPRFNHMKQSFEATLNVPGVGLKTFHLKPNRASVGENYLGASSVGDPGSGINSIALDFSREVAEVRLQFRLSDERPNAYVVYRPVNRGNDYRRNTVSADYGPIQHASSGRFIQDGTTVFQLVPWSLIDVPDVIVNNAEGFYGTGESIPRSVPRTITVQRVNR